jgi:hypothetical protein
MNIGRRRERVKKRKGKEGQMRASKEERRKSALNTKKKETRKTPLEIVSSMLFGVGYRVLKYEHGA